MKKKIIIMLLLFILCFYIISYASQFTANVKYNIKATYKGTTLFDPTKLTHVPYEIQLLKDVPVSIYELSKDNKVTFEFDFENNQSYNNLIVVVSSYDNLDCLLDCKLNIYDYISNTNLNDKIILETTDINNVYKFKLFIFDNLDNIKPLVNNFTKIN